MGTRLVSRSCHAGAVANVHFKWCRSRKDGHRVRRKVPVEKQKAFECNVM